MEVGHEVRGRRLVRVEAAANAELAFSVFPPMTDRAAHLEHPSGVQILTLSSYLYLLNVFGWIFNYLFHAGLVGQVILGIIYGTPVGQLLPQDWETTLWQIGYLGLVLIVFEGMSPSERKLWVFHLTCQRFDFRRAVYPA